MRFEAPGIGVSTDAPSQAPRTRSWFLPFMEAAAHILVASDVHGRIPMLVRVAFEYQRHFQRKVEAILVSGDLGIWPRDEQLDSSTAKRSRTDPEELGFRAFRLRDELGPQRADVEEHLRRARATLGDVFKQFDAPIYFVGGNHEDYVCLARLQHAHPEVPVRVDLDGALRWIPHGAVISCPTKAGPLRIGGLGGIAAAEDGRNPKRYHPLALIDDDAALALMDSSSSPYDVLLTHDSSRGFVHEGHGSSTIETLVAEVRPTLHISGHYHSHRDPRHYEQPGEAARTLGVHVNTFVPDPKTNRLRPNSLGVITVRSGRAPTFEFAPETFLRRLTAKSWYTVD